MTRLGLLACLFALTASMSCSLLQPKAPELIFRCTAKELPTPGTRVMVWAIENNSYYVGPEDTEAEHEAILWLEEHGLVVVRGSEVEKVFAEESLSMQSASTVSLLWVGRLTGAKQVILLHAYSDRVMVRAADTKTGVIVWSGTGQYVDASDDLKAREHATSLTRKTLDAIWKSKS